MPDPNEIRPRTHTQQAQIHLMEALVATVALQEAITPLRYRGPMWEQLDVALGTFATHLRNQLVRP